MILQLWVILSKSYFWLFLCVFCLQIHGNYLISQGVTSATVIGTVLDDDDTPLQAAHIILIHVPTSGRYGVISGENGRFNFPNVKVGGPYTLTISYIGFLDYTVDNFHLRLGQEFVANAKLEPEEFQLSTVEIIAKKEKVFSEDRTGAATNVDVEVLEKLPTIKRSLTDYIRLSPQASVLGEGISFAGMNNRYNNFSIDGTVNNDVFGLSNTGTNGGQTGTEPISLDAVEEMQVEIAPFDVRYGGFTGGSINAITRSGSNNIKGSAYYLVNNERFSGTIPLDPSDSLSPEKLPEYFEKTSGIRLGAPIIKDKLFLFTNIEYTKREAPTLFNVGSGSAVSLEDAQRVENKLIELSGTNQGGFQPFITNKEFYKFFLRLDWNMNDRHKFTLRHNYVYARQITLGRREERLQFNNTARNFPSNTNSTVLEVQSRVGNNQANELRIGYTNVRDEQNITGEPFPYLAILESPASIIAGSGRLFTANKLDQDIYTITDHYTFFKNNHIITLGTHNEFYRLKHLNIPDNFGTYSYGSIDDFEAIGTVTERPPRLYVHSYSKIPGQPQFAPSFKALQMAFYVQDEFYLNDNLKLIGGLRAEIPVILDDPTTNEDFNEEFAEFGVATNKVPGTKVMLSPRIGFNWDLSKERSSQLRGGIGMFVSRVPFVWFSNQFSHTGIELANIRLQRQNMPRDFRFSSDPFDQPNASDGLPETAEINVTDEDFKYPKVLRINLGHDHRLPWWGLTSTFEFIYSKRINDIDYKNLNLLPSTQDLEGADNRPYFSSNPFSPEYTRVLMLTNADKGHAYNFTFQVQKPREKGIEAALAYTYGRSKDINSGASSMAGANWGFVEQVSGPNELPLSISRYDFKSRINGYFQFTRSFFKNTTTSLGLFYNGQTGLGVSFVYEGDVNNDGEDNDLIYIPEVASDIILIDGPASPEEQWSALDRFIKNDDYLSGRRGQYADRNGKRMPFEHHFDLKIMQEFHFKIGKSMNRVLLTFDIFNVANLLNSNWGRMNASVDQRVELIRYMRGGTNPEFYFDPQKADRSLWTYRAELSTWRGQFGIRYIFE